MIISKRRTIEDIIIETLAKNPYTEGPDLVSFVKKVRQNSSKQAVYHALNYLLRDEVVAKVDGKYFLSKVWLLKLQSMFLRSDDTVDTIFNLNEGDSISYRFPSFITADTYWAHLFHILMDWMPNTKPIFVWYPHDWFVVGRREIEKNIFNKINALEKRKFIAIKGKTVLDQEFRKGWSTPNISISTGAKPIDQTKTDTVYINIFDDYIIEVFIDNKLAQEIESFYQQTQKLDSENIQIFINIVSKKYPVRIKISKKSEKAKKMRRKIARDFAIPTIYEM